MLKKVKISLKQINDREFKGVRKKVEDIRSQLKTKQENIRDPTSVALYRQQEKELQINLEKWSVIEESVLNRNPGING